MNFDTDIDDPANPDPGTGEGHGATRDGIEESGDPAFAGAPEDYDGFAAPEGVTLDDGLLGDFKGLARELDLPQQSAQKLVDLAVRMRQADAEAIVAVRQSWLDASKADREFGGDRLHENLATAKRGVEAYGSPALAQLLNETGLGNHPEFVRLFVKIGRTVSEYTYLAGGRAPAGQRSLAERLYPTSKE
jgi:hypothetical protein